ncbi:hypothetical protein QGN29_05200 [Temperatibacter marinus]|uniref:Uncharacterized protein n=1 Tax=Temperatibacter marinus TaxID=1456591 RepID=A0AA52HA18_9PROT|nr:hypothetical protein [Temperatibacter marinus]WND03771.1 hypothetical protein QGN29_05200 [Temperatibacter marinus]
MTKTSSLMKRIIIGKSLGFLFGLIGTLAYLMLDPTIAMRFQVGFVLWYTTLGAIVAMMGVYTYHPLLKLSLPWWFRGTLMGVWMNFLLVLFAPDVVTRIFTTMDIGLTSPYWLLLEGAVFGLLIDYLATRYAGEGAACALADQKGDAI